MVVIRYINYLSSFFLCSHAAVTFSSWEEEACRGAPIECNRSLEPYACVAVNSNATQISIMASGLRNTNANSGDYIQVFTDVGCQQDSSTIKYSDLCLTPRYRSLKYLPPGQMQDEVKLTSSVKAIYLLTWFRSKQKKTSPERQKQSAKNSN